jgi:flagellar FliL protein
MVTKQSPELTRFQQTYLELERDLLANLTNSRKVMQVQVALMTRYDDRVFKNVKKHEFALRSAALDVMRKTTEQEIAQPDFRKNLAESIRQEMNAVLEKFEDFGGIEEVYFTNFVIQ